MDHFLDIRILPDPEFAPTMLMNALYAKLHRALVQLSAKDVGLSFPDYDEKSLKLGERLRLHGTSVGLEALLALDWLKGMRDHLSLGSIGAVPANTKPVVVRRVQSKSSVDRIRRRQMRRHSLSAAEAQARIPATVEKRLRLPYLTLKSRSTDQQFRLFVSQKPASNPVAGEFNAYGLSASATLPLF